MIKNLIITIALIIPIFISNLSYAQTAPVITILSPSAILEPSKNKPSDKDGFPPINSNADPEEGVLGAMIEVTTPIFKPTVSLIDDDFDSIDDLTIDNRVEQNIDYLDEVNDEQLAPGKYYLYWNLDKTGYDIDLPDSAKGNSLTDDREAYRIKLTYFESPTSVSTVTTITDSYHSFVVTMEPSASISQNDLRWLETYPDGVKANIGDKFKIRTKYSHQSLNPLYEMILHCYYSADIIRLDGVDIYYYDTNGDTIPSISDGVPPDWDMVYHHQLSLIEGGLENGLPVTLSEGDVWVSELTFTVLAFGGSRLIPYFQTKPSVTANWKVDTGFQFFQVEPPDQVNIAELAINKDFSVAFEDGVVNGPNPPVLDQTTVYEIEIIIGNTGNDNALDVVGTDTIPAGITWQNKLSPSKGTATFDLATRQITWNIGTLLGKTSPFPEGETATLRFQVSITPTSQEVGTRTKLNEGANVTGISQSTDKPISAGPTPPLYTLPVMSGVEKLGITKSVNKQFANPGDTLTYTINYINTGQVAADGVTIIDPIPEDTSFIEATEGGIFNKDTGWVIWNIGILKPGSSNTVAFSVKINDIMPEGTTTIKNVAVISSDFTPGINTPPVQTIVSASSLLDLDKSEDSVQAIKIISNTAQLTCNEIAPLTFNLLSEGIVSGTLVTYTLTYSNSGNANATGVVITDKLPDGTTFVSATDGGVYNPQLHQATWNIEQVNVGTSSSVRITVSLGDTD